MTSHFLFICILLFISYGLGYLRAYQLRQHRFKLYSRPTQYGGYQVLCALIPGAVSLLLMAAFLKYIHWVSLYLSLGLGSLLGYLSIHPKLRAHRYIERFWITNLMYISLLSLLITGGLLVFLVEDTFHFFQMIPLKNFLLDKAWIPQDTHGHFGILPLVSGTFLITLIGAVVAAPLGLFFAIYTAFYAPAQRRQLLKPFVEVLAGIPSIVFGFFALFYVTPFLQILGGVFHVDVSNESALSVGLVLGFMMLPYMASLSDEALTSLPPTLRDHSYALGATKQETIIRILLPAALPGLTTAFLLSLSRAIGETMLVLMAGSLSPNLTLNPLEAVTTLTVQIISLLTGDQSFDSPRTLSAFALGFSLFLLTLTFNALALTLNKRFQARYGY